MYPVSHHKTAPNLKPPRRQLPPIPTSQQRIGEQFSLASSSLPPARPLPQPPQGSTHPQQQRPTRPYSSTQTRFSGIRSDVQPHSLQYDQCIPQQMTLNGQKGIGISTETQRMYKKWPPSSLSSHPAGLPSGSNNRESRNSPCMKGRTAIEGWSTSRASPSSMIPSQPRRFLDAQQRPVYVLNGKRHQQLTDVPPKLNNSYFNMDEFSYSGQGVVSKLWPANGDLWVPPTYLNGPIRTQTSFGLYAVHAITALNVLHRLNISFVTDEEVLDELITYFESFGLPRNQIISTIDNFWIHKTPCHS